MELCFRFLLTTSVLLTVVNSGKLPTARRRRCNPDSHKYYVPSLEKCRRCPPCAPGWGLPPHPQEALRVDPISGQPVECYNCTKCPSGYYSQKADRRICQPCLNCNTLARRERTPCSPTNNTVCGECQPMYYDIYMHMRYKTPDVTKPCKHCSLTEDTAIPECGLYTSTLSKSPDVTTVPSPTTYKATQIHERAQGVEGFKQNEGETPIHSSGNSVPLAAVVISLGIVSIISAVAIFRTRHVTNQTPVTVSYNQGDPEGHAGISREEEDVHELQTDENSSADPPSARPLLEIPPSHYQDNDFPTLNRCLDLRQKMLLRHVGRAWPDLARAWGLTDADVEYLRAERWESEGERIHQMILTWERKLPLTAKVGQACQGLKIIGRHLLAQELLNSTIDSAH